MIDFGLRLKVDMLAIIILIKDSIMNHVVLLYIEYAYNK